MLELNLPKYSFKIKETEGKRTIFDRCRKKFVALTPEEWVRQNMVEFLIREKGFSEALIGNEVLVKVSDMHKRCDTVIYGQEGQPILIVEYKAPHIEITQKTFDQIAMYNFKLKVSFLIVSNGLKHYCCEVDYENNRYNFLREIPTRELIYNKINEKR
ncbi:MAG: type I restriction enzyme HsdR N-terminal domain-containing protein [Paludibacteraceae bacterium]|nr:type I restriction enzyme HsdR N-terminal domain-containing protein [Paludibacteraceae bacterium]